MTKTNDDDFDDEIREFGVKSAVDISQSPSSKYEVQEETRRRIFSSAHVAKHKLIASLRPVPRRPEHLFSVIENTTTFSAASVISVLPLALALALVLVQAFASPPVQKESTI